MRRARRDRFGRGEVNGQEAKNKQGGVACRVELAARVAFLTGAWCASLVWSQSFFFLID